MDRSWGSVRGFKDHFKMRPLRALFVALQIFKSAVSPPCRFTLRFEPHAGGRELVR